MKVQMSRSSLIRFALLLLLAELAVCQPTSAAGLVEVGTQPAGGLSGKIVYIHGGHGYTAENLGSGDWIFQRGKTHGVIEDLGNQEQMTHLAGYLFRAGATIVPLRPVGHQKNELIVDNVSDNVTFKGDWSNSTANVYFGNAGDVPYRYALTSPAETAFARYQPKFPQAGFYPVYAWTSHGDNRASDQLYRVRHSGGITEVKVNHRRVGNGLVYLGTYYFEAGTNGYVDISNRSGESDRAVIADMIRFGNGMGDIDCGGGVSGRPREDEAGLYWVKWHVDRSQGIPESEYRATNSDRDATVSLSPRYAAYMNREQDGGLPDRVFVSFHSNASGSKTATARGTMALYNGNNDPATTTPNQFLLADTLGRKVNDDMVAQKGVFKHDWFDRTTVTLDRGDIEFGEINNLYVKNEFDATIVEVAFHDNREDARLLRDPKVRDALARATYQGIVNYFRAVDGNATPVTKLPTIVTRVRAKPNDKGGVTLTWQAPHANSFVGDAATGYRIYASLDRNGFDGGTYVPGGDTTTATLDGYAPAQNFYFKIAAINDGGESPGSKIVSVPAKKSEK
jgi:hypothetical protein